VKLADRPAHHLARLALAKGVELDKRDAFGHIKPVSLRDIASGAWPDGDPNNTHGRVAAMKGGARTGSAHVEAIAAYFGVDAGVFYQEPTDA